MKYIKLITLLFVVVVLISACNTQRQLAKNRVNQESYSKYLSSVINDTSFFEFPQFNIVDKRIYPVLDSVILHTENCRYFDASVKYLNTFRFGIVYKNGKPLYSIDAHISPAQAIGLILVETKTIKQVRNVGIFYYKNYLFVIPSSEFTKQNELTYFPFVKKTDNVLKIRAPKFFEEKVYSSYVGFTKLEDSYKIIENKICGDQVVIR